MFNRKIALFTALALFAAVFFLSAGELTVRSTGFFPSSVTFQTDTDLETGIDPTYIKIEPKVFFNASRTDQRGFEIWGDFKAGGNYYTITLKEGFPHEKAANRLSKESKFSFVTRDIDSSISFVSRGTFFPLHAPIWELPVRTVNHGETINCQLSEIYPSSRLNCLNIDYLSERFSRVIAEKKLPFQELRNIRQYYGIDLEKIGIPRGKPGFYKLKVTIPNAEPWNYADTKLIVTDLAPFCAQNGNDYLCNVRRLSAPEMPVPNATVNLYSRKQQLLATGVTGADGTVRLSPAALTDRDDYVDLLLVSEEASGDFAYLELSQNNLANQLEKPRATLFADRGVMRPGEEIAVTAALRKNTDAAAIGQMPIEFILTGPRGNRIAAQPAVTDEFGMAQTLFTLPDNALIGTYTVSIAPPGAPNDDFVLAVTSFIAAEFTPDTISAEMTCRQEEPNLFDITGKAKYYFGQPASGAKIRLNFSSSWADFIPPKKYRDYTFGWNAEETWKAPYQFITKEAESDQDGNFQFSCALPDINTDLPRPVTFSAQATIKPAGGVREITAHASATRHAASYLGAKVSSADNSARVSLICLDPEGHEVALPQSVDYELNQLEWIYALKEQYDGTKRYLWERISKPLAAETANITAGGFELAIPFAGYCELRFRETGTGRPLGQIEFWHSAGESAQRSPNPSRLDFRLDQEHYAPGETAKISFDTNFDGEVLAFTGTQGRKLQTITQHIKAGENTIETVIPTDLSQGTWFVAVTAVGSISKDTNGVLHDAPYLSGTAAIPVRQLQRKLSVELKVPAKAQPGQTALFEVQLKDADGAPVAGEVALWGVDEGVLALSKYQTPDLFKKFFGAKNSPFALADLYSGIYPMLRVVNGEIGGGLAFSARDEAASLMKDYQARRFGIRPPEGVLRLGLVKTDENGCAAAQAVIPELSGALRVMAVASSPHATGSTDESIIVTRPVSVSILAPLTAAPGDNVLLQATVFNHTDAETTIRTDWTVDGAEAALPAANEVSGETALLAANGRLEFKTALNIPAETPEGALMVNFSAAAGETRYRGQAQIILRSPVPAITESTLTMLAPGESRSFELGDYAADAIRLGSPMLRLEQHLEWLNNYPYGCLEQVTAAAFPQLAVPALVKAGYLPEMMAPEAQRKIEAAKNIIASRANGNQFTMWPDDRRQWTDASIFAWLFQLEAERLNLLKLSARERRNAESFLREYLNNRTNPAEERALATYALALVNPALVDKYALLLPLESTEPKDAFSRFLAGMALLRSGFAAEGARIWSSLTGTPFTAAGADNLTGFNSPARRTGLALWLLSGLLPDAVDNAALAVELAQIDEANRGFLTTHEHSWLALGLANFAMTVPRSAGALTATLLRNGEALRYTSEVPAENTFRGAGKYTVTNTGSAALFVECSTRKPQQVVQPISNGFEIRRSYRNSRGEEISSCKAGELISVYISISAVSCENIVISDLLPGCFEIEDERLATRMTATRGDWDTGALSSRLVEKRFDRCLIFGDISQTGKPASFTYQVRAVAPGIYAVPPIQIEAMYQPRMRALSSGVPAVFTVTE